MIDTALAELLAGAMAKDDDRGDDPAGQSGVRHSALAQFLDYRLQMLGLTPTELAEVAGVSRSTVYRLRKPIPPTEVDTEVLHKLATALETDPQVLAELWHGITRSVDYRDDRDDLVRSFVLATSDLSYDELRSALEVARAAASLARPRGDDKGDGPDKK